MENAYSTAERRAILHGDKQTQVWISDLVGIIPSITGKIELVYEGEQEGPYQVAVNLMEKAIRSLFVQYFPNPDSLKKRRNTGKQSQQPKEEDNPYRAVIAWFDAGNKVDLLVDSNDREKINALYQVDGLHSLVKKFFNRANENEMALLMEFVLHGLSSYSLISKRMLEGKVEFKDLMGSMLNLGGGSFGDDDDFSEDDFT
jgi:magnesium chelatase subunit I